MSKTLAFAPPAISVDIEDWPQSTWDRSLPITERAATNARNLMELLSDTGVHATMFVLGKFAEKFPQIVREMHFAGHEIGSHGYGHEEIFKQTRAEFSRDIRRSKDILEQIIGTRISGYRAPDFSVVKNTLWALEGLAESGFEYDSSIFPVTHSRYGIPDWPTSPVNVRLKSNRTITEAPIGTSRWFNKNFPTGGGGYHRLLPGFLFRYLARSTITTEPFVFYCHPYELDTKEFHAMNLRIPLSVRLHQGLGRRWVGERLRTFLRRFGGRPIKDLLAASEWPIFTPGRS